MNQNIQKGVDFIVGAGITRDVAEAALTEIAKQRDDVELIHFDDISKHGTLKNGVSFVIPCDCVMSDLSDEENGDYHGNMIVEIRDDEPLDYWVGDWERIDEDS